MRQIDGSRSGVRVQIKRCALWQAKLHASRSRMHSPAASSLSFSFNVSAAGLSLKRTPNVMKFKSARARFRPDRTRSALVKREVATARLAVEATSDVRGMNRAAARPGINRTLGAIDIYASRSGMRAHAGTDT